MIPIVVETHLIFHVIANLEIQIVFEISWQIGARKYSHIAVISSLEYFPSSDTILVNGNDEPCFSNCVTRLFLENCVYWLRNPLRL